MTTHKSLFEGLKTGARSAAAASTELAISGQHLAPEQKLFNQLRDKIEKSKASLQALVLLIQEHRIKYAKRMSPLEQQQRELQKKLVLFLDGRLRQPTGLSKPVRAYMVEMVCSLAEGLMNSPEGADLQAVYERHASARRSGGAHHAAAAMQDMMTDVFGVDLDGDEQLESPEQVMAAAMRKLQQTREQHDQEQAARQAKRKKTPKQLKAEREAIDADKVLRDIYRKLASALHPDREPDEAERQRKTALMVEVNVANEKKDLLALLQLQLRVEQIDPAAVSAMAADKLRHFNRVLKEQALSLHMELTQAQNMFRSEFNLSYGVITPKTLDRAMREDAQEHEQMLQQMAEDLVEIQDDRGLKNWVKTQKSLLDEDDALDHLELMAMMASQARRR